MAKELIASSRIPMDADRRPLNYPMGAVSRPVQYRKGPLLGQGAFGIVNQAWDIDDQEKCVAIKHMKSIRETTGIPQDAYREIKLLKELNGFPPEKTRNIVKLERVFMNRDSDGSNALNLVYGYAEHDLAEIIRFHRSSNIPMDRRMIKSILFQLLNGLKFLHENWIMHRDM